MEEPHRGSQGARDVAAALPFAALVLLMPPIILIAAVPLRLAGVPFIVIYIFGVWAAVIVAAFLVARVLARDEPEILGEGNNAEASATDIS